MNLEQINRRSLRYHVETAGHRGASPAWACRLPSDHGHDLLDHPAALLVGEAAEVFAEHVDG